MPYCNPSCFSMRFFWRMVLKWMLHNSTHSAVLSQPKNGCFVFNAGSLCSTRLMYWRLSAFTSSSLPIRYFFRSGRRGSNSHLIRHFHLHRGEHPYHKYQYPLRFLPLPFFNILLIQTSFCILKKEPLTAHPKVYGYLAYAPLAIAGFLYHLIKLIPS